MAFNKKEYDVRYYQENVTRKFIPFNRNVPEDCLLLDWLNQQGNVTKYIKDLIRADIKKRKAQQNLRTESKAE